MAAADTLIRILVRPGDHVILGNDAYGGSYRLLNDFTEWGVEMSIVNTSDTAAVAAAVQDNTRLIWLETPTNPALNITDIAAVAKIKGNAQVLVDNTFATPYLQNPLELGADHVLHSTTKYLGGHSDVLGGAVVTNDAHVDERLLYFQGNVGAVSSPFDAYLTAPALQSPSVRMDRHCANAQKVAEFLQGRPEVKQVLYPGLKDHPGHKLAAQQMRGFGGMMSVRFHDPEHAKQICLNTRLICLAESLGGVESLIEVVDVRAQQEQLVGGHAAIHAQLGDLHAGVRHHGIRHIAGLVSGCLEDGACQVSTVGKAGQADDDAAGIGTPVRSEETRERWDDVHATVVLGLACHVLDGRGVGDELQVIAQPLH